MLLKQNINFELIYEKIQARKYKYFNESEAFIEYQNNLNNIYGIFEEYHLNKKCKTLIAFDDMIADMISKEKENSIVAELFISGRKLNISLAFIKKIHFKVPKHVRLNTKYFFIMTIQNKQELKQTV